MTSTTLRKLDYFYVFYFVFHAIITILIDAAIVIPRKYQLSFQTFLLDKHIQDHNDPLVADPPVWFQSFVVVEVVGQLPFFFIAAYAFAKGSANIYITTLVYGVVASITTYGCLAEVMFGLDSAALSASDRQSLIWMYLPTFVIPLGIAIDMSCRISKLLSIPISKKEQ
ncbi:transmembrane protein 6/97 [Lipomyces oligophaga]|uniref:transmembrane protein 6/97 n=1 Tax=Lipomyces oligophaga TaxID=45792 RepID=UPI0034CF90F2